MLNHDLSSKLFRAAKEVIPGGVNSPVRAFKSVDGDPFFVQRARGSRIWDVDGNELIDYIGTWGPAILGHAPSAVIDAVSHAAKEGLSFGIPNRHEVEIARMICDYVPSVEKVRMVNSGTEATMTAIRLARGYTGRDKIIKFDGCYHGHVDSLLVAAGSGALTLGKPDSAGVPEDLANLTITLPFNHPEVIEAVFRERGDEIAAIILEPYPANAGLVFPRDGYLQFLREITEKYGTILIFDEVMTGFRLAKGGVQELVGITPDLTAMGKVIGGGLPVGAFGGKAEIMDHLAPDGPVYQAGTLSGNPLALVAGITQLKEMERLDGWSRLEQIGQRFEDGVRDTLKELGRNLTLNRVGSMFCLFFSEGEIVNVDDVKKTDAEAFRKFFWAALERGVYFAPSLYEAGFISLAHGELEMEKTVEVTKEALREALS
ncbi:glutamate-1-semialdehyde 2,1-aminomutase [Verrucomicrobiales bacterium]|jgi:glutamate-1-semialdehyde 2,1-aminomutase|nr:glutamate-1-semialdehyde 2,1-aminomutase [Verrucomicrobiales bacterium]MDA9923964.1 glutamate-1-semialdehyde 2,1-aminomutase [Verrucomicrobiales bacterium]